MLHARNIGLGRGQRCRLKQQRGLTLVEILVAITIYSIALLGLAIGTVTLTRTNADSHLSAVAINVAQARLEELKAMNGATQTTLAGSCLSYASTGCSDTFVASGTNFARSWRFIANSPVAGVNQIDVKVDWTDHINRSLTFSAAVSQ